MIDGRNFFGQPVKRWFKNIWQEHSKRFKNIQKIATIQSDNCRIGCLLDY